MSIARVCIGRAPRRRVRACHWLHGHDQPAPCAGRPPPLVSAASSKWGAWPRATGREREEARGSGAAGARDRPALKLLHETENASGRCVRRARTPSHRGSVGRGPRRASVHSLAVFRDYLPRTTHTHTHTQYTQHTWKSVACGRPDRPKKATASTPPTAPSRSASATRNHASNSSWSVDMVDGRRMRESGCCCPQWGWRCVHV